MKWIRNIARYLIAIVFIFSGFVKAIDPLGSTYKFTDYFEAFGMDFLSGLSLAFSLVLSSAELLIGLCLFFKIRMKAAAWALLIFMGYFTLLTLFIAITNPVTDCGCFGDALILTNWETFFKNLIFLVPTLIVFQQRNHYISHFSAASEWVFTAMLFLSGLLLSFYCIRNLPLIDFRPYKTGANIEAGMQIPEGMPVDQYEHRLVYEKEGVEKEFTLDAPEQPWNDSSWTWVETRNILVKEGYVPPIHDFTLTSVEGEEVTNQLLQDSGYSLLIVSYDVRKSNRKGLEQCSRFAQTALENGYSVYGMTASVREHVDELNSEMELPFEFYTTDDITLKTMIRSNPGVLLVKEGTILAKWHYRNIPGNEFFNTQGLSNTLTSLNDISADRMALIVVLFIGLVALVIYIFRRNDGL